MATSARRTWYVDSSVLLRAIVDSSRAASVWFENAVSAGDRLVASRLVEIEVRRVVRNIGGDQDIVTEYLDEFVLIHIPDDLLDEASVIEQRLGGADSIHIATALRIGTREITVATHDRQMAAAALALGVDVIDPVTDDPNRGPVA